MKSSSLHLRLIYLCTSPWPWTPGVVKTAAKAFPDVAAQCQEKKIPRNPRRFCLSPFSALFVQVKEDGNTFFKTKGLFLVFARCFKVWETFVNLINTYRYIIYYWYFQYCIYSKRLVFIEKTWWNSHPNRKQTGSRCILFVFHNYIEGAQISILSHSNRWYHLDLFLADGCIGAPLESQTGPVDFSTIESSSTRQGALRQASQGRTSSCYSGGKGWNRRLCQILPPLNFWNRIENDDMWHHEWRILDMFVAMFR